MDTFCSPLRSRFTHAHTPNMFVRSHRTAASRTPHERAIFGSQTTALPLLIRRRPKISSSPLSYRRGVCVANVFGISVRRLVSFTSIYSTVFQSKRICPLAFLCRHAFRSSLETTKHVNRIVADWMCVAVGLVVDRFMGSTLVVTMRIYFAACMCGQ